MSSYISSAYYLERERLNGIMEQCRHEMQWAMNAIQEIQAEQEAGRQQSRQRQQNLLQKEQAAQDAADRQLATAAAQRRIMERRARTLMEAAVRKVEEAEQAGESGVLREQLYVLQNALELYGATEQLCSRLEAFDQYLTQRPSQPEVVCAEKTPTIQADLQDRSREFVSLHSERSAPVSRTLSPWPRFLERLRAVCEVQEPLGESTAQVLLEQAMRVPAEQQNWFLLSHQAELTDMEEAAAEILAVQQAATQRQNRLWQEYRAVCLLRNIQPNLSEKSDGVRLEQETQRLFTAYKKQKEQEYVTNAFTQVLERYGIEFDTMEATAEGTLHLEYSIGSGAQLCVSRSEAGSFEMEFTGVTSGQNPSMEERRQVTEQAKSFCSLLPQIAQELKDRGVLFDQVALQQPDEQNVRIRQRHSKSGHQETRKAKAMPL